MPGHVKASKPGTEDPDPVPYLVVTLEMKREDMLKPYDAKKSYWCPDMAGGYTECMTIKKTDTLTSSRLIPPVYVLLFK